MGDRANIQVKNDNDQSVYLYTHWDGSELPETLQVALAKRWRWDDEAYLARIIFCEMVKEGVLDETGFGIASYVGDGEDRVLVVDTQARTVSRGEAQWTFEEYIALSPDQIADVWRG